jgi:hypothetical protein
MSVRFTPASTAALLRSASLLDVNATYTWIASVQVVVDTNAVGVLFGVLNNATGIGDSVSVTSSGTDFSLTVDNVTGASMQAVTLGQWYTLAMVRESSTSLRLYVNGALVGTDTTNVGTGRTVTRHYVGSFGGAAAFTDARIGGHKQWTAALTADEVRRESLVLAPRRTTNLLAWYPSHQETLADCYTDLSGGGLTWSSTGSPTREVDAPPVSWGGSPLGMSFVAAPPAAAETAFQFDAF